MPEHNMQELLNRIIDSGKYALAPRASPFMCNAAWFADKDGIITSDEFKFVEGSIAEYLETVCLFEATLAEALDHLKLPSKFENRLALYRDWANRPMPK